MAIGPSLQSAGGTSKQPIVRPVDRRRACRCDDVRYPRRPRSSSMLDDTGQVVRISSIVQPEDEAATSGKRLQSSEGVNVSNAVRSVAVIGLPYK